MTRPICITPDCNNPCQNTRSTANPVWRKHCSPCHVKSYQSNWTPERFEENKLHLKNYIQEKHYSSYEAITKNKCTAYFNNDKKQNKWNGYNTANEMADDLIDLVHENMKRNNGEVRCEVTNVVLSHELKDIFQISFDRIDNTIGHDRSNIRIVLEPVNTWIKDKFTINDLQGFLDAVFVERMKAA